MAEPQPEHLRALGPGAGGVWRFAQPILQSGGSVDALRRAGGPKLDTVHSFTPKYSPDPWSSSSYPGSLPSQHLFY